MTVCGISVVLDRSASPESARRLLRMHEPIRHRGPDGEGFLHVERGGQWHRGDGPIGDAVPTPLLGMAFRRLKILDLSEAAAQPMGSADGSLWIVHNGEIYNFAELRNELRELGYSFRTSGDTEVLLRAFEAWDTKCFERLDGMWALVIADLRRRRLVLSRDRFGIKPLYWALEGDGLLVASEIKQIVAARARRPEANRALVAMFLRGVRVPCLEETFFDGIRAVPPATWCEVALDGVAPGAPEFQPYWDLAAFTCQDPDRPEDRYPEALAGFEGLLATAVASHQAADVRVGSLLSGGLDSSTLVGLLADPVPTFSFGFGDAAPDVCELRYVDAMVRHRGLENHRTTFDSAWVVAHAPKVIRTLEEPPLALPALAQYRVFQLCREHATTVVLDGQGADEILGGYASYQRRLLLDRLRRGRLGELRRELAALGGREAASMATEYALAVLRRHRARRDWLAAEYGRREDTTEYLRALADRGRDPSLVNRQLYSDVKWGNVKIVLAYGDKNAMAHSVEARVPYFDRRVVEFAFRLPDRYKVGGGQRKRILRDVARRLIPAEITERRDRMGFGVPDGRMVRGGMWPSIRELLVHGPILDGPCFDARTARQFVTAFESGGHDDFRAIWRLYALGLWQAAFDVRLG